MMTIGELKARLPEGWDVLEWFTVDAKGGDWTTVTVMVRNQKNPKQRASWTCPLMPKPMEMQFQQFLLDFGLKERAVA